VHKRELWLGLAPYACFCERRIRRWMDAYAGVLEHRQLRELLEAAVDCLKPERGEKLLRLYHTAGLPVTAESLSWLLEGYRRCHRWEQAAEAYRTSERRYGVVADHRGMLVMIHVEGRRGDWRKALGIYEQVRACAHRPSHVLLELPSTDEGRPTPPESAKPAAAGSWRRSRPKQGLPRK
jgi:hypothetical protein